MPALGDFFNLSFWTTSIIVLAFLPGLRTVTLETIRLVLFLNSSGSFPASFEWGPLGFPLTPLHFKLYTLPFSFRVMKSLPFLLLLLVLAVWCSPSDRDRDGGRSRSPSPHRRGHFLRELTDRGRQGLEHVSTPFSLEQLFSPGIMGWTLTEGETA